MDIMNVNGMIDHLLSVAGINQTNIWIVMAFLALILGGLQTSITHVLKQEKWMSRDDRSQPSSKSGNKYSGSETEERWSWLDKEGLLSFMGGKGRQKKTKESAETSEVESDNTLVVMHPGSPASSASNVIDFPGIAKNSAHQGKEKVSSLLNFTRGSARR